MTELYIIDTTPLRDSETFNGYLKTVSRQRAEKAAAFRFAEDRALSLGAGILIGEGLKKLGLSEKNMIYKFTDCGKPYFENYPEIFFSISHSGCMAVCAFSDAEVGCDIEEIKKADLDIAERFYTKREREYIKAQGANEQENERFFRIWTLKESLIKATGEGLSRAFTETEIDFERQAVTCDKDNRKYYFKEYNVPGYKLACCSEKDVFAPEPTVIIL